MKELFGEYNCGMICKNSEDGLKRMLEEVLQKKILTSISKISRKDQNF